MVVNDGFVKQATVTELIKLWLQNEFDEVMSFSEYLLRMRESGVMVVDYE